MRSAKPLLVLGLIFGIGAVISGLAGWRWLTAMLAAGLLIVVLLLPWLRIKGGMDRR